MIFFKPLRDNWVGAIVASSLVIVTTAGAVAFLTNRHETRGSTIISRTPPGQLSAWAKMAKTQAPDDASRPS